MKRKRKPKPPLVFVLDVSPYARQYTVSVGAKGFLEITRGIGTCEVWFANWLREQSFEIDKLINAGHAFCMSHPTRGGGLISLHQFEDDWDFWETLIHELHHAVEHTANVLNFEGEQEAKAYLQQDLFRRIRRKIQAAHARKS